MVVCVFVSFFFYKQKTAYEMRISDWSSDVCSSDLSGVDIYIDQYELRMADACAGLNSLFSLVAIGMFYIYLRHRADWRYALVLTEIGRASCRERVCQYV